MDRRAIVCMGVGCTLIQALGGCALETRSAAGEALASSRAAVAAAEAAQAERYAPEELTRAREKIDLIGTYEAGGQHRYAIWLGEQAKVDADVARIKALIEQRRRERAL